MQLRITADDYGLTAATNAGIERLVAQGAVTAVSVMVHPGAALGGVSRLVGRVRLGLHLVLVAERPLVPSRELVDGRGHLPRDWRALILRLALRPSLLASLVREARAQLDRYRVLGLPLDFVNSHQHVHLLPPLWWALGPVVESTGAAVRSAATAPIRPTRAGLVAVASKVCHAVSPLPDSRLIRPLGIEHAGRLARAPLSLLAETCRRACEEGVSELVAHPGDEDAELHRRYGHWRYDWAGERELLASGALGEALRRRGVSMEGAS